MKPTFPLDGMPSEALVSLLDTGWEDALASGIVTYDPGAARTLKASPFYYHCLPQRQLRPRSTNVSGPCPESLLARAHVPCPFDAPGFLEQRGLAWVERQGRAYVLSCNKFPVAPGHFLAIRDPVAATDSLPQCIHGATELQDILLFVCQLGPPFRGYFNSNRGTDGSASGSSINHWHIQFFRYFKNAESALTAAATVQVGPGQVHFGRLEHWPAQHVFVETRADTAPAAAEFLWQRIAELNRNNIAYNVEAIALGDQRTRTFLFPRRHAPDVAVGDVGSLSMNIGGCELDGHFVLPTVEIFDWMRAHPAQAQQISRQRLSESTRPVVDPPNAPTYNAPFTCRPRP